jgi:hypothetical protein
MKDFNLIADILWYTGHILTGIAIFINHYEFYEGISFAIIGQFIIIISRPIGRIKNSIIISDDTV